AFYDLSLSFLAGPDRSPCANYLARGAGLRSPCRPDSGQPPPPRASLAKPGIVGGRAASRRALREPAPISPGRAFSTFPLSPRSIPCGVPASKLKVTDGHPQPDGNILRNAPRRPC